MSGVVFVTGAAGQLGSAIVRTFADAPVVAHTRATLDITSPDAVRRAVGEVVFGVVERMNELSAANVPAFGKPALLENRR